MLKLIRHLFYQLMLLSPMLAYASGGHTLPPQQAPHNGKSALLMIEFVNEWLAPDGKLRGLMKDERQFNRSQLAAQQVLAAARKQGMPVIHATLQLSADYREFGNLRFGLRGAIPSAKTWQKQDNGWQFYPPFAPVSNEFVISGRAGASAFAASDLDNYLRGQGITRLYLAGYATHVCIESTLRAAHDLGYEAIVLSDATAAFNAQQQMHVLQDVVHHFGWAMSTQQFVERLSDLRPQRMTPSAQLRTLTAPGPEIPGISGAVAVQDGLLLLSGHVPVAADGSVPATLEGQLEQTFQNLDETLRHAGSNPQQIARMTFYVSGYIPEQLETIRTVRDRWLKGHAPASALIGGQALYRPDVKVEIDAIAVRH